MRPDIYVGLVHWPVLNSKKEIVATNVTNFDIHDIARVCRSYGIKKYYIINRLEEQLMFVERVLQHWNSGTGSRLNPMRRTALQEVKAVATVDDALRDIGEDTYIVTTAAREMEGTEALSFKGLRERIASSDPQKPLLILFGTGSGLHEDVLKRSHGLLEPIWGAAEDQYRHLSVRSAVSICLDRLLASW